MIALQFQRWWPSPRFQAIFRIEFWSKLGSGSRFDAAQLAEAIVPCFCLFPSGVAPFALVQVGAIDDSGFELAMATFDRGEFSVDTDAVSQRLFKRLPRGVAISQGIEELNFDD